MNVKTVKLERSTFRNHVTAQRGQNMFYREIEMFAQVPKMMEAMAEELEAMGYEMSNHEVEYSSRNYIRVRVTGRKVIE